MGNSGLKQHIETAKKTGTLKLSPGKLSEFPPDFQQLQPHLRTLDISENKFETLPSNIGSFSSLRHLTVNNNRLIRIPESIENISKLESISFCSNRLTELPASLSTLKHLKQVYLSNNSLKVFPLIFCGLKHLDVLDLSQNKIAEVPDEVKDLWVIELNVNQNQISTISECLADCPRLKTLRLEENCLQLQAIPNRLLTDSKISLLAVEGNLFEMKGFMELEGHDVYMERYTAVKKKLF